MLLFSNEALNRSILIVVMYIVKRHLRISKKMLSDYTKIWSSSFL